MVGVIATHDPGAIATPHPGAIAKPHPGVITNPPVILLDLRVHVPTRVFGTQTQEKIFPWK